MVPIRVIEKFGEIFGTRRCLPKSRLFACRLILDILPTKLNKFKRRLEATTACDLCGAEPESSHHVITKCLHAKALWDCVDVGCGLNHTLERALDARTVTDRRTQ
jgi:hypothetical protein